MRFSKLFTSIILTILVSLSSIQAQVTSGEVIYKYKIYNDYLNIDSLPKNKSRKVKDVFSTVNKSLLNYQNKFQFNLIFDENSSNYYWNAILQEDGSVSMDYAKIITGCDNFYYSNLKDGEILESREFIGEKIVIKNNISDFNWKLINESKKIGDYVCFKATTMKKGEKEILVEAWFTPQIPLGFGPKGYAGLPGLILELKEGGIYYYSSKVILNPKKIKKIKKVFSGKIMTLSEFEKLLINLDKSRSKY